MGAVPRSGSAQRVIFTRKFLCNDQEMTHNRLGNESDRTRVPDARQLGKDGGMGSHGDKILKEEADSDNRGCLCYPGQPLLSNRG